MAKTGLDDFFASGKTLKDAERLIADALPAGKVDWPVPFDPSAGPSSAGRSTANGSDAPERVPVVACLTEVTEKAIDWIWPGWLARSMLTILGGYAGDGKSTILMDLIARLTRGGGLPDGTRAPKLNVLILAAEDDPEYAIKPRLRVHGADMDRVFILKGIASTDGKTEWFNLRRDIEAMREVIAMHRIGLVVIDPLSSYMPKADRNSEGDVRDALMPLQELMEQSGVAVLAVMHVGKADAHRRAVMRLLGSTAFSALARCVWMVHELPEEHQADTDGTRKMLAVAKANYSVKPRALAWSRPLDGPIAWHGPSPVGIEEAFAGQARKTAPKRADAEAFLREVLKGGSKLAREVFTAARDEGIRDNTLRAAAKQVGIERIKAGYQGQWLWSLPRGTVAIGTQGGGAKDAKGATPPTSEELGTFGRDERGAPDAAARSKDAPVPGHGMNGIFGTFGEHETLPASEPGRRATTWEDF